MTSGSPAATYDTRPFSAVDGPARGATVVIAAAVVLSLYFQRFVLTELRISIAFAALVAVVLMALLFNVARIQTSRLLIAAGLIVVICVVTVASSLWSPFTAGFESMLLLIVSWIGLIAVVGPTLSIPRAHWDTVFMWCALPAAFLIILQVALQFTPVGWLDPIMQLPASIRYTKLEYSVTYEYVWGSGLNKPNGFFFVEPSLASQFMALGALAAFARKPVWAIPFGIALALTASGTGLIAMGVGIVVVFFHSALKLKAIVFTMVGLLVVAIFTSPLGQILAERTGELDYESSSGSARFVNPFEVLVAAFTKYPMAVVTGFGSGTGTQVARSFGYPYANLTFLPKAAIEYRMIFATLLAVAVLSTVFASRGVSMANRVALALMIFILSGALIQGPTALLVWSAIFAAPLLTKRETDQTRTDALFGSPVPRYQARKT